MFSHWCFLRAPSSRYSVRFTLSFSHSTPFISVLPMRALAFCGDSGEKKKKRIWNANAHTKKWWRNMKTKWFDEILNYWILWFSLVSSYLCYARRHQRTHTHSRTQTEKPLLRLFQFHPCPFLPHFTHLLNADFIFRFILKLRRAIVREYFSNLFFLLFSVFHPMDIVTHTRTRTHLSTVKS